MRSFERKTVLDRFGNVLGYLLVTSGMTTASIDDVVLADSDETVVVEGNHYFPPGSVNWDHFEKTDHSTVCGWKGTADYYSISVPDRDLENVAWAYPDPKDAASEIKDYVAFYSQVTVA